MAHVIEDRVMETSTTTGTGNFSLAGAVTGFIDFDSVMANGDTCHYLIEAVDANGVPTGAWETGLGTFNDTDTLVRTAVERSSNSNAAVSFSAGTKRVSLSVTRRAVGRGTAFPSSPYTGEICKRTDRSNTEYFYDGTRWLSTQLFTSSYEFELAAAVTADANVYCAVPFKGLYDIYLERMDVSTWRTTSGEWDMVLSWGNSAGSYTTITTIDGSANASATWVAQSATINSVLDATANVLRITLDEISGSTNLLAGANITYRLVG